MLVMETLIETCWMDLLTRRWNEKSFQKYTLTWKTWMKTVDWVSSFLDLKAAFNASRQSDSKCISVWRHCRALTTSALTWSLSQGVLITSLVTWRHCYETTGVSMSQHNLLSLSHITFKTYFPVSGILSQDDDQLILVEKAQGKACQHMIEVRSRVFISSIYIFMKTGSMAGYFLYTSSFSLLLLAWVTIHVSSGPTSVLIKLFTADWRRLQKMKYF